MILNTQDWHSFWRHNSGTPPGAPGCVSVYHVASRDHQCQPRGLVCVTSSGRCGQMVIISSQAITLIVNSSLSLPVQCMISSKYCVNLMSPRKIIIYPLQSLRINMWVNPLRLQTSAPSSQLTQPGLAGDPPGPSPQAGPWSLWSNYLDAWQISSLGFAWKNATKTPKNTLPIISHKPN